MFKRKEFFVMVYFLLLLAGCTVKEEGLNNIESNIEAGKEEAASKFFNALSELDKTKVEAEIKAQAEANWDGDYEMQDYQYNNQMAAYHEILDFTIDEQHKENILNNAITAWQGDYEMIRKQYKNQLEAYQWIEELNLDTDIKRQVMKAAKTNWGDDYESIRKEYEKQIAAVNQ